MFGIVGTPFPGEPVQEVAGVKLHAGLGGEQFHRPAATRVVEFGEQHQVSAFLPVDHVVVVVAAYRDLADPAALFASDSGLELSGEGAALLGRFVGLGLVQMLAE